ncbi:S1-like domain-containing RNA-binding protein [Lentisphaera profundi]|uniref:S1-like domain-containing RNA-binding protein n=1 Tax=Lentisphaera profundi TaxID=1658616 RepID=A0ABY7VTW9_9BACT|nr:S1-like domain-containing RNA-binding protein [Lentisphaera profundi]WDE97656.1 S1-like domain-containing RNA-binding protein [Lentisphaera profundi]
MIDIGSYNTLRVLRLVDFGAYLGNLESGQDVLIPKRYCPEGLTEGDDIEVFIYTDSEDRIIATTETPLAIVGECAFLDVIDINDFGAFLDWGLPKDLFVPFSHQPYPFQVGQKAFVYLKYDDVSQRVIATGKVRNQLKNDVSDIEVGNPFKGIIYEQHELGWRMVVDNKYHAMIFDSDFTELPEKGDILNVFVKAIRNDGKLDVTLFPLHEAVQDDLELFIIKYLKESDGVMPYDSKSSAETVQGEFGVSRKVFKKALGALYKKKYVDFADGNTRLL